MKPGLRLLTTLNVLPLADGEACQIASMLRWPWSSAFT